MKFLLLPFLVLSFGILHAQNMISNGSFEEFKKCPKGLGELSRSTGWTSPNGGSPDFFSTCYSRDYETVGVPNNYFGTMAASQGNSYAGILHGDQEIEYLQIEISEPLVEGRTYSICFNAAAPSPKSDGRNALGVLFTQEAQAQKDWTALQTTEQPILEINSRPLSLNKLWSLYSANFTATGKEQYLVIGYFKSLNFKAYSFIDNVNLIEDGLSTACGGSIYEALDTDTLNFIANPNFEQLYDCPTAREELSKAKSWRVAANTPDFYHVCGTGTAAVPDNQLGSQTPQSGNGYGGFWALLKKHGDYREYISARLKNPLEAGKIYCLSIYINLAEISDHSLEALQMQVSIQKEKRYMEFVPNIEDVITLNNSKLLDNTTEWMFLHGTFVAKGGENSITIGNFKDNDDPSIHEIAEGDKKNAFGIGTCYYYIDNIGLHALGTETCPCPGEQIITVTKADTLDPEPKAQEWKAGDTLVFRNLQFGYNRAEILPQSLPLLDSLIAYLVRNPQSKINIIGHTDSDGDAGYNQTLSQNRAASVMNYLVSKGILPGRISAQGSGESAPCAPNDTEAGKALNRRVEITFSGD